MAESLVRSKCLSSVRDVNKCRERGFPKSDFRLISQVAQQLWEVKDRKIEDLSKSEITIVQYKAMLAKNSQQQIERARLVSKQSGKMKNV